MMPIGDWDLNARGKIALEPLLGSAVAHAGLVALLQLQYARTEKEFESGGVFLQLSMTAVQARQLGEDLLRTADRLDATHLGTAQ